MKKFISMVICFSILLFIFACSKNANLSSKYEYKKGDKIKEVIPLIYADAGDFSEGIARVKKDDKYGYIDKTGKEVIPIKYDGVSYFYEGLAHVGLNGKWGCIDKEGNEIMPFIYDSVFDFSEGIARVKKDNKYGYISFLH